MAGLTPGAGFPTDMTITANGSAGAVSRQGETVGAIDSVGDVKTTGTVEAGIVRITGNAAPADGTLAAGDAALWFDSTNGAGKLMVKAKQADGTVKTGSFNVAT